MTLPTIFQMFWGQPKIDIEFKTLPDQGGLYCYVFNRPIGCNFLKKVGVYRRCVEDLIVSYTITNKDNIIVSEGWIPKIDWRGEKRNSIPGSLYPARIDILFVDQDKTFYFDKKNGEQLTPQVYTIELSCIYEKKGIKKRTKFVVHEKSPYITL